MDSQNQTLLVVLGIVVAAALVIQSIAVFLLVVALRKWLQRTSDALEDLNRKITPVATTASEMLTESREKIQAISSNIADITQQVKSQVGRVDAFLTDTSERARLQVVRLDQLISNTMSRVDETTEIIQNSVVGPVRELSAILAGVKTALDVLFRRNKSAVDRVTHDEELFI